MLLTKLELVPYCQCIKLAVCWLFIIFPKQFLVPHQAYHDIIKPMCSLHAFCTNPKFIPITVIMDHIGITELQSVQLKQYVQFFGAFTTSMSSCF